MAAFSNARSACIRFSLAFSARSGHAEVEVQLTQIVGLLRDVKHDGAVSAEQEVDEVAFEAETLADAEDERVLLELMALDQRIRRRGAGGRAMNL